MNYLIAVVDDMHTNTALVFTRAVIAGGHNISRVFFFKNGVRIGANQHRAFNAWNTLAQQYKFELILCSAATATRDIKHDASSHFSIGGLGLYAEAQIICDKVVHFD